MSRTAVAVPTPVGRAAPVTDVIRAQAGQELRMLLGNGEQILLTLIIPVVLLVGMTLTDFVTLGTTGRSAKLDLLVPGILALAIMSSAFTALAIATGFDRRSEAIKFLGTTPLSRTGLLAAKILAVLGMQAIQLSILGFVGFLLGWVPDQGVWWSLPLILFGTAAFAAWGFALAGVLKAELTLALANAVYLLLLLGGGVIVPADRFPPAVATVVGWLPSAALADGLRAAMGPLELAVVLTSLTILALWAAVGALVVHRTFRWTS